MITFVVYLAVNWWATWYPGAEPGGGGYIAQRMLAAKDEKNAIGATMFWVSDLAVARRQFVDPSPRSAIWGLPLYYGAQLLFAWAAAS